MVQMSSLLSAFLTSVFIGMLLNYTCSEEGTCVTNIALEFVNRRDLLEMQDPAEMSSLAVLSEKVT